MDLRFNDNTIYLCIGWCRPKALLSTWNDYIHKITTNRKAMRYQWHGGNDNIQGRTSLMVKCRWQNHDAVSFTLPCFLSSLSPISDFLTPLPKSDKRQQMLWLNTQNAHTSFGLTVHTMSSLSFYCLKKYMSLTSTGPLSAMETQLRMRASQSFLVAVPDSLTHLSSCRTAPYCLCRTSLWPARMYTAWASSWKS